MDVTLTLKDKCGAILFSRTDSTHKGNTGAKQTVSFSTVAATLNTGEYQLTKQAVINEEKLAAYTQSYLASSCAKTLDDFQAEEAAINTGDCNLTCESCKAEIQRLKDLNYLTDEQLDDIDNLCASICNDNIDCRASLNAMKVDMSPNGQYAELNKSPITMPDNLSSMSTAAGSNVLASLDNIDIDHKHKETNELHPELFPLSIFNPDNKLPLGSYLSDISAQMGGSNEYWRFPIAITKTGDAARSKKYQILKDASNPISLGGTTQYTITEYKDANGDTAFVYVQKIIDYDNNNAESFTPAIQNTAQALAQLKLVDADVNLYKIPVRYLQNLADFRKEWLSHWAYNMLPYHPEFPYYVACLLQSASNNFDYQLMNMTLDEAKTKQLVSSAGEPQVYAKEEAANAHVKLPQGFQGLYELWMNVNAANYAKQGTSMVLLANRMANCPTGVAESTACGVVIPCDKTTLTTDLEWTTYRALYLSAKQNFLKNLDMFKAVNQGYYNGCIGHTDYKDSPDAWYFSMVRQQTITGTVKICPSFNWARNRCRTWNNVYLTVTIPSYFAPNQICFVGNAGYFAQKHQQFYPSGIANTLSSQQTGNCPEVTFDDDADPRHTNPIVSLVPCAADLTALKDAQTLDAERMKYELCGLCPAASDLEALLTQLKANNKLVTTASPVSCANSGIALGTALKRNILAGTTDNPVIYWTSTVSPEKKTVTGIIQAGSTDKYTVALTIPANIAYTFDDLVSLCCLTVSNTATNAFTMKASFKKNKVYEDFFINGVISTLNLKDCTILPKCALTNDASDVAGFLNLLSVSGQLETSIPVHLFDGIDNNSSDDYTSNVSRYFDAVLSILNISGDAANYEALKLIDPVWSITSQSASGLSGKITYQLNGTNTIVIQISYLNDITSTSLTMPDGSAHSFTNQPKQFYSLSPVSDVTYCTTNDCSKEFDASMISITNNQFVAKKVRIHVPVLAPVTCTTVIPATVNRK